MPRSDRENSRWVRGGRGAGRQPSPGPLRVLHPLPKRRPEKGASLLGPLRSHRTGPARGPFSTVSDATARGPGADDSPGRLITALNNFALDPGEAGVATARERGCARACRGAVRTHLRSCHPLSKFCCGDTTRARSFMPFTRSVGWCLVSLGTVPGGPSSRTKPHPHREAARAQGPLAHFHGNHLPGGSAKALPWLCTVAWD